jgi:hypothetical protein
MEIDEIIRRLERIAPYGTHYPGEPLFVLSLDDGIALKEAIELLKNTRHPDCEHAEWDGTGCLGYCGCTQDDEPIEACKRCRKYTGNIGGENTDA